MCSARVLVAGGRAHVYLAMLEATATVGHTRARHQTQTQPPRQELRASASRYLKWLEMRNKDHERDERITRSRYSNPDSMGNRVPVPPRDVLAMWAADLLSAAPMYYDEGDQDQGDQDIHLVLEDNNGRQSSFKQGVPQYPPLFHHASRLALQAPSSKPMASAKVPPMRHSVDALALSWRGFPPRTGRAGLVVLWCARVLTVC